MESPKTYTCPMHPEVKSDQPGKCPKCGMDLMPQGEHEQHKEMVKQGQEKMLWTHFTIVLLGLFLLVAPFTFGYTSDALIYSDMVSGILLIVFSLLSINPFRLWAPWASCFIGLWLLTAPLVFWAPDAAAYLNDTITGALVIALAVLIPSMPGMSMMRMMMPKGPDIPPGWTYNPSAWIQRWPIILLGWIGFMGSRYLAAYQLGYIDQVWDPFFGEGTQRVLTSEVSKSWPISDAGLGTMAYTIEALMGYMGDKDRWRTMPWMVTFFGILVIPLGVVSIVLVILQPVAVGFWCSICLLTAIAMLIMIPLTVDEVVAMIQFLHRKIKEGKPFWRTFWMGDTVGGGKEDDRSPGLTQFFTKRSLPAMWWGVNAPWNLLLSTALGIWLMFAPYALSFGDALADSDHLVGALIVTFSVIAMAEVTRYIRFTNILFGAWLIAAPFLLEGGNPGALWNDVIIGIFLIGLNIRKGKIKEHYGNYDASIV